MTKKYIVYTLVCYDNWIIIMGLVCFVSFISNEWWDGIGWRYSSENRSMVFLNTSLSYFRDGIGLQTSITIVAMIFHKLIFSIEWNKFFPYSKNLIMKCIISIRYCFKAISTKIRKKFFPDPIIVKLLKGIFQIIHISKRTFLIPTNFMWHKDVS